ncbi:MAG: DHA2 family efflux MFS transporter permease subunit [Spongiibacteraceae bacterium]
MTAKPTAHWVPHPHLLLGTLTLNSVTVTLDSTIANVALPHMQGGLGATQDQIGWVLTSYIVATAICLPLTGILTARIGRRRFMMGSVIGFMVASMLCGTATSLTEMVAFRILQGMFGACLPSLGQVTLIESYPPEKHGKLLSIWGFGAMMGPVLGPSLGGYLTEALNWRWVFYINVPICLLSLVGIAIAVPDTERNHRSKFDFFGFGTLALMLGSFQLMLDRGHSLNWFQSAEIMLEAAIAALCAYLFVVHMLTAREPFLKPVMFRDRNLLMALILMFLSQAVLISTSALVPSFLQQLMHIPVDTTGYLMMPRGIGSMLGMLVCGRLIGRVANRNLLIFGFAVTAFTTYQLTQINLNVDNATILQISLLQGFGMSFSFAPLTATAFLTLAPQLRNDGAAISILMRNLGASVGISVLLSRIAHDTQANHAHLTERITQFAENDLPQLWQWQHSAGAMLLNEEITRQATSVAYLNAFTVLVWCSVLALPVCLLLKAPKQKQHPDPAAVATAAD